ncbi:MAG TPA: glycosyltransferase family 4 protein [Allosphingosinicella sp.]
MDRDEDALKMLVFDMSYTLQIIRERQLEGPILARDLDGFFAHVWNVHPIDTIFDPSGSSERSGRPEVVALAPRHTFIRGRMERYRWPRLLKPLNFILAQMSLLRMLRRLIRREGIEVIRAEDSWYCGLLALYLARRTRLPLIIGVWGNPGTIRAATGRPLMPRLFRKIWVEELVERIVLRSADRVIAQNEDNRRFVVSMGVRPEKARLFRLGNIVHPIHFEDPAGREDGKPDLAELGLPDSQVLLIISRLEPLKFNEDAVRALGLVKDSCPRAALLFAGDGSQRAELAKLAESLGVGDRVVFAGNRDQQWLARVVPHVSAVICPLTGRALAEAGLGGVPLIAYDVDWHSEIVESGVTGELVAHRDVEAMARAIERLLGNPDDARRLGSACRARIAEMMDPASLNQIQRGEYLELLTERGRRVRLPAAAPRPAKEGN